MFPILYHAHHIRHAEDLPYWLELARRQGSPILELGCGTGRVLLPLAKAGYQTTGLDNDPRMLEFLRSQVTPDLKTSLEIVQADLISFELAKSFKLIILPCNTWTSLSQQQRKAALTAIRSHLEAGGVFAASLPNPNLLRSLPVRSAPKFEEAFAHPLDGGPVKVSSAWKRMDRLFTLFWYYDHQLSDGRTERLTARVTHHLASAKEFIQELTTAGFKIRRLYGDYQRSPFEPRSQTLIWEAAIA